MGEQSYYNMCNTCFNLDFHKPNKDRCKVCTELRKKINSTTKVEKLEEKYETYQNNKNVACEIKANETLPTQVNQASINLFSVGLGECAERFIPGIIHLVCVRIKGSEMLVFGKFCVLTKWMIP